MLAIIHKFASPKFFYDYSGRILIPSWLVFIIALAYGVVGGLYLAPADYQQGDAFRIMYVHVPSAVLSLTIYLSMATAGVIALIWRIKLAEIFFTVSISIGASLTALALITGALWGQPTWGTWWLWDARLTSELILLFLYIGASSLQRTIEDKDKAFRASSILVLVGTVDLPIIHYSVYWWNTLHQKATVLKFSAPSISPVMLYPLLSMMLAFFMFYIIVLLLRARNEVLSREYRSQWVKQIIAVENNVSTNF